MKKEKSCERSMFRSRFFLKIPILCSVALALLVIHHPSLCLAKDVYPAEKISWLIPYKAGGGFDLLARGLSPYLTKYLREASPGAKGGVLILRNEPAAGGQKAYNMVYNARKDGYTLSAFDIAFATETLLEKLDFDIDKFTFLIRAMSTTRLIVTQKTGFANWDEMLKSAKTKELKWGTGAFLKSTQIDSIIVTERAGIPTRFIPWGGGTAECMNALIRGDIQVALVSEDSVKGLLDAGEIKVLAAIAEKSKYPGAPSIKDLGFPDLIEKVGAHRFVVAPPALPNEIKNILVAAFKKAMNDQDFQTWAKKIDIPMNPLFGDEAEREGQRMIRYYQQDVKPIVLKYAK